MTDYTYARFYAISGLGYGKGHTAEEAKANYVAAQLANYDAKHTVFKTKPKFREALTNGEVAPDVWHAPEGTVGFTIGDGSFWEVEVIKTGDTDYVAFSIDQRVEASPSTRRIEEV